MYFVSNSKQILCSIKTEEIYDSDTSDIPEDHKYKFKLGEKSKPRNAMKYKTGMRARYIRHSII